VKSEAAWLGGTLVIAALVVVGLVTGQLSLSAIALVLIGVLLVVRLGQAMVTPADQRWLTSLLAVAFIAKIAGAVARFWMVTVLYGQGDSFRYYQSAIDMVHTWRQLEVPEAVRAGGEGTHFIEVFTSFLFLPGIPSLLVGFMIFASLAFVGQVFFYAAFRRWVHDESRLILYGTFIFFMPSLLFWPSSIGKDAVMVLALGIAAYGISRLFGGRFVSGAAILVPGLALAVAVRTHVAAIFAVAVILALALSKGIQGFGWFLRLIVLGLAIAGLVMVGSTAAERLDVDLSAEGVSEAFESTQGQTEQGGSAVVGSPVTSPLGIPDAILRVLFRPLPTDASSPPMALSAIEGMLMLLLTVWRFPTIIRNIGTIRTQPYVMSALLYTFGFIFAFSSILNLGIMVRQRAQVLPFVLVALVALGWNSSEVALEEERVQVQR
jgi:hypothetical protein